jgi:hypothetical protein
MHAISYDPRVTLCIVLLGRVFAVPRKLSAGTFHLNELITSKFDVTEPRTVVDYVNFVTHFYIQTVSDF